MSFARLVLRRKPRCGVGKRPSITARVGGKRLSITARVGEELQGHPDRLDSLLTSKAGRNAGCKRR
jgi:hypothetical protein